MIPTLTTISRQLFEIESQNFQKKCTPSISNANRRALIGRMDRVRRYAQIAAGSLPVNQDAKMLRIAFPHISAAITVQNDVLILNNLGYAMHPKSWSEIENNPIRYEQKLEYLRTLRSMCAAYDLTLLVVTTRSSIRCLYSGINTLYPLALKTEDAQQFPELRTRRIHETEMMKIAPFMEPDPERAYFTFRQD